MTEFNLYFDWIMLILSAIILISAIIRKEKNRYYWMLFLLIFIDNLFDLIKYYNL